MNRELQAIAFAYRVSRMAPGWKLVLDPRFSPDTLAVIDSVSVDTVFAGVDAYRTFAPVVEKLGGRLATDDSSAAGAAPGLQTQDARVGTEPSC